MGLFKCLKVFLSSFYNGLKFFSRKDPPFYEIVESYEEYHSSSHITDYSRMRLKLIEGWIEPYSSVLEIGCGEGFNLAWLRDVKKVNGVGIDISVKAIEKVRSLGFEGYVRDVDVEGIGFGPRQFDYVIFIEVLEHLKFPHRSLMEACKIARKGIIVTLPNTGWIGWRAQMLRGYFPRQSFTHLHFFSIRDFEIFLREIGLKPQDLKTDFDFYGVKSYLCNKFKNLLAYQQAWLIKPC